MEISLILDLDSSLLRELSLLAVEEGRSINALLVNCLEAMVRERKSFEAARRRAVARLRDGIDLGWTPRSRAELHER